MSDASKRRRIDPPAREATSVHVDGSDSLGVVLGLVLARFEKLEEKLERVREEHVETRAELSATRRALAELTDVVKSSNPTFDVNEQLAFDVIEWYAKAAEKGDVYAAKFLRRLTQQSA